ncbi:MAG: LysE family translocator [Sciscionella sp.]|nr:LysE family translocator [Sciscionella sp.]
MVSTSHFLAFALLSFVLIAVPGPSVLFTIGRAMSVGRRAALLTVLGNTAGVTLQLFAVAFGVGAVVRRSIEVFTVIKFVGVAYLIFLGVQAIRHRHRLSMAITPRSRMGTGKVLRDGFVVGVTNPKAVVFFTAFLPQFVDPAAGRLPLQMLLLGSIFPVIALASDSLWALLAGTAREWFARSPRRMAAVGGAGGLAMIAVGVRLAFTGRND